MTFTAPVLEYALLAPMLIVLGGAIVGVLIEAFARSSVRASAQLFVSVTAIVMALAQLIRVRNQGSTTPAMATLTFDGAGVLLQGTVLIIALLSIFLIADQDNFTSAAAAVPGSREEREAHQARVQTTEVFPLTLFAVAGMMLFPVANDLITLFVALEVLSLPLYLMAGLSRYRRMASQEAALKYFLLGAFSSAFFLFGAAFLYGYSSSLTFAGIQAAVTGGAGNDVFLLIGLAFVSVGLLFKVGAFPFHAWSPDVYQGSPTAITAFNDLLAIGAQGATDGTVAITGYDNTFLADMRQISLTSVDPGNTESANIAAQLLLKNDKDERAKTYLMEPKLIV